MWLTIITMATVGYGDYFPSSYFGRVIGMLSCFWGVFTLSTFVVILNNLLAHNQGEQNAYELLVKMKLKDELKASSINVMFAVQKHTYEKTRERPDKLQLETAYIGFRKAIFELKRATKQVQVKKSDESGVTQFMREISDIHKQLDRLRAN